MKFHDKIRQFLILPRSVLGTDDVAWKPQSQRTVRQYPVSTATREILNECCGGGSVPFHFHRLLVVVQRLKIRLSMAWMAARGHE